jgi:hypothetical protein
VNSQRTILFFILALALVRGLIYASIVPPWQAPDEPAQFERARASLEREEWTGSSENEPQWYDDLIASLHVFNYRDFVGSPRELTTAPASLDDYIVLYQAAYGGEYGSRPTFAVVGWPLFLARSWDITLQLYLARLNTVVMNVGIIFFAYLITRTIFPADLFLILGVPIFILFVPQHTHLLSTVNSGNLAELLVVVVLYLLVRGLVKGATWPIIMAILVLTMVAMWAKATAYFLPVVILMAGVFYGWPHRRYWPWLLPATLLVLGLGYLTAPVRLARLINTGWIHLSSGPVYLEPTVPIFLFRSYWAMPGWLTVQLHPIWYQLLALGCSLAVSGLVIFVATSWHLLASVKHQARIRALVLLAVAILVAVSIILGWNALTNSVRYRQGRSIYPVMIPISLFLMLGWRQLIPRTFRSFGLLGFTAAFFLFDTMVLFDYVIPFFYAKY